MKLDINNPQHAQLLAKYLNREMDPLEREEFEGWIDAVEENALLIRSLENQWERIGKEQDDEKPDVRKAWNSLHSRLIIEGLVPPRENMKPPFNIVKVAGVAATIILVLGIAAFGFWYFADQKQDLLTFSTENEKNTLVRTLEDGSIVYMADNTVLTYPKAFGAGERSIGLEGEAFFDIAPDPGKPFVIETREAYVKVLGTAFNLHTREGDAFELAVTRGKVQVVLKDDPENFTFVTEGERVVTSGHEFVKARLNLQDAYEWYNKRMHFKDESLYNILAVLNKNFNTKFVASTPQVAGRKLTVTFEEESVESLAEIICLTLNLTSQHRNDSIILSESYPAGRQPN